jgi:tetratricopeptide (TPR) repeat protein
MTTMLRVLAVSLALALATPAHAAGSGKYQRGSRKTPSPLETVEARLAEEQWEEALLLLAPLREERPRDADVWNLTGYASRKLGRIDEARRAYDRALSIEPEHRRAHEYLGELFLQIDDPERARMQLAVLDDLCFFPCREERMLRKAIEVYEERSDED